MKRVFCLLLALLMLSSFCVQAFADVLYCRSCGKLIPADSNYCPYCGEAVVPVEGSATPKTSAPASTSTDPGPFKNSTRVSGSLRVTKSPTSENVEYGGGCLFIAHADNASSVVWYLANSDATVITEAGAAPSTVSGLYVSGDRTDTLHLSGIPSWMNGYQVQARFTGNDGTVYTEIARIWTFEKKEECKWTYWDMLQYCYEHPWAWPYFEEWFGIRPPAPPPPGPGPGPGPDPGPGPGPGPGPFDPPPPPPNGDENNPPPPPPTGDENNPPPPPPTGDENNPPPPPPTGDENNPPPPPPGWDENNPPPPPPPPPFREEDELLEGSMGDGAEAVGFEG